MSANEMKYPELRRSDISILFVSLLFVFFGSIESSLAQSAFTYEGRLFTSAGAPVLESVSVKFQILNPAGTCVLYEEVQSGVDLSATKGAFSLSVGSAASDAKRSANFRGAYNPSMLSVFRNSSTLSSIPVAGCAAGTYASGASDTRLLRVEVTKSGTTEVLSPDLVINAVPSAQVAQSLQGFLPTDFLRLDSANGISGNIGLTAIGTGAGQTREFRFYELAGNGAEYFALKAPDAMTTALTYVFPSGSPTVGQILAASAPAGGVVTLSWANDAGAGGGVTNFNGSIQSSQSFAAIDIAAAITAPAWSTDVGTGAHTLQIPMAVGAGVTGGLITKVEHTAFTAKVDRAGDTMTGNLTLSGTAGVAITGSGTIAMGTNKITALADPTANQEAATKAYVDSQASGKISGTLTSGRIPVASGASTLADSANLTFNSTTGLLSVGGTAPSITSGDAITIAAGGTNKNVVLTPSGTGFTLLDGNVGIGTSAPTAPLTVGTAFTFPTGVATISAAGAGIVANALNLGNSSGTGNGNGVALNFTTGSIAGGYTPNARIFAVQDGSFNGSLAFSTSSGTLTERVRIDKDGNIGIGTTLPVDALSIGTAINASATRASVNLSNTALVGGSVSGTYLGANPAAFTGNFIDLQVAGASKFKVSSTGVITGDGSGITGISGSLSGLTAGRVPYTTGPAAITDSSRLTWDNTAGLLTANAQNSTGGFEMSGTGRFYASVNDGNDYALFQARNVNAGGAVTIAAVNNQGAGISDSATLKAYGSTVSTVGAIVADGGTVAAESGLAGGLSVGAFNAAGILRFYSGGAADANERLRILANGNIGIGTTTPTAGLHNSKAGAASTPAERLDGAWFTGGSATTTKPQLLVEPAGATSTAWSTSGTGLGVNSASGFTGNLIDAQLNGVSKFSVSSAGVITGNGSGITGITASPAGNTTEIQYNNAGATAGSSNLTWTNSTGVLYIGPVNGNSGLDVSGSRILSSTNDSNEYYLIRAMNVAAGGTTSIVATNDGQTQGTDSLAVKTYGSTVSTSGAVVADGSALLAGSGLAGGLSIGSAHASGELRFYSGGVAAGNERVRVLSDGKVGIGTATPFAPMHFRTGTGSGLTNTGNDTGLIVDVQGSAGGYASFHVATQANLNAFVVGNDGYVSQGAFPTLTTAFDVRRSVTAVAAVGTGGQFKQTLTAAANNDVLTAMNIEPTFSNGAFSGVKNYGLIVSAGRVGIGTTAPQTNLDVSSTGDVAARIHSSNDGGAGITFSNPNHKEYFVGQSSSVGDYGLSFRDNSAGATRLHIGTTGNVGIGTTSPNVAFQVGSGYNPIGSKAAIISNNGGVATEALTLVNSAATANTESRLGFVVNSGSTSTAYVGGLSETGSANSAITFGNFGAGSMTEKMRIASTGNVGIGTTSPDVSLAIQNALHAEVKISTTDANSDSRLSLIGGGTQWQLQLDGNSTYGIDNAFHIIQDTSSRLVIDTSGNVGIGTTTPQATLDINGTMRLAKNAAQPFACDATHDGSIALTSSTYKICVCKGGTTTWVTANDGVTGCTW